jgi:CO/xanthine dehydrogenase Mo-binding subunit
MTVTRERQESAEESADGPRPPAEPAVGGPEPRSWMVDGYDRVTGRVEFSVNTTVPGMLTGLILRSDCAHGRIVRIDTAAAKQVPGVRAVVTGADIVARGSIRPRFGPVFRDQPILAIDKVRYVGEPVAAVAADSPAAAAAALELIEVEYDLLPAVFTTDEAIKEGAPLVQEERAELGATFADIIINPSALPNICNSFKLRKGDIEQGFAEADHIFENTFTSPAVQHSALETHCSIVDVQRHQVFVSTGSQIPYMVRGQLAEILQRPASSIRVTVPTLGGGYGSKCYPTIEPIAAVLSVFARRPVRIHLTREEEFVTITKHAVKITMKTGVKSDGTIVARKVEAFFNTGAYADIGPRLIKNGGYGTNGPTSIPHVWIDSHAVHTNVCPAGAFRGYGISQAAWAYESQIEIIAEALGIDPYELRMKNLLVDGETFGTGEVMEDCHFKELLTTAKDWIGWEPDAKPVEVRPGVVRGKGLSCIIKGTITPSTSTATVKLNDDGSFHILTSSIEMGQGVHTLLSLLAAEQLQIPLERIKVAQVDTDVTPYDQQTSSSRSTHSMGMAVTDAVDDAKRQLFERARGLLGAAEDDELEIRDGAVAAVGTDRSVSYTDVVRKTRAGNIVGRGIFQSEGGLDPETGQGIGAVHWHQAAAAAEVDVDLLTGRVRLHRYHGGVYAGRIINPVQCELQTEGNLAFGLGQALYEELLYDEGQLQNGSLADYMITSIQDMPPELNVHVLEADDPENAELHGIGETSLPAVMPAVANAVFHATGVRIHDLPLTAEKVLRGIKALQAGEGERPENPHEETA